MIKKFIKAIVGACAYYLTKGFLNTQIANNLEQMNAEEHNSIAKQAVHSLHYSIEHNRHDEHLSLTEIDALNGVLENHPSYSSSMFKQRDSIVPLYDAIDPFIHKALENPCSIKLDGDYVHRYKTGPCPFGTINFSGICYNPKSQIEMESENDLTHFKNTVQGILEAHPLQGLDNAKFAEETTLKFINLVQSSRTPAAVDTYDKNHQCKKTGLAHAYEDSFRRTERLAERDSNFYRKKAKGEDEIPTLIVAAAAGVGAVMAINKAPTAAEKLKAKLKKFREERQKKPYRNRDLRA